MEKTISLAAGESQAVVLTVTRDDPGTYLAEAGGKTTSFTISSPTGNGVNWLLIVVGAAILVMIILFARQFMQRRLIS
jgi:hypothetical protein